MKSKRVQNTNFDVKKWAIFFLFLLVLAAVLFFLLKPKGEVDTDNLIARARLMNQRARVIAQQSNATQDMANLELSTDALEKAILFNIESNFTEAKDAAERSLAFAQKVIREGQAGGAREQLRFQEIVGEVLLKKKGGLDFEMGTTRSKLTLGDLFKSSSTGSCKLAFDNGMEVTLEPNTAVAFQEDLDGKGPSNSEIVLLLESGTIKAKSSETDSRKVKVITGIGRAVLYKNTSATVSFNERTRSMEVKVGFGRTDLKSGTKSTVLGKNQKVVFSENLFNKNPKQMPNPPVLSSPASFSKFKANQNGFAAVALRWETNPESASYQVELSEDSLFVSKIEVRDDLPSSRLEIPDLKVGTYYWRVAGISPQKIVGLPTQVRQFQILGQAEESRETIQQNPPKLKIQGIQVQGKVAIISGSTERDATIKVNGEMAIVDKDDGQFNFVMKFPGPGVYAITVAAESSSGSLSIDEFSVEIKD